MQFESITPIQDLFKRALPELKDGEKISIFKFNDFGALTCIPARFMGVEFNSYAQYNDNVKLIIKIKRKRGFYILNIHDEFILAKGWIKIPVEDLMLDTTASINRMKQLKEKVGKENILIDYEKEF